MIATVKNLYRKWTCKHRFEEQVRSKYISQLNETTVSLEVEYSKECLLCGYRKKIKDMPNDLPPPIVCDNPGKWFKYEYKPIPTIHISELEPK